MVLAKKKLKQQLRSLLAVSVEAAESGKPSKAAAAPAAGAEDVNRRLQSLRELLVSKNRRDNRPTRRGGRKRRRTSPGDSKPSAEAAVEGGEAVGSPASASKGKKRKRAGDGAAESNEQDQESTVKRKEEKKKAEKSKNKKNRRKKKRKSDKKKNAEEEKDGTKTCSSEKKVTETATIDSREENGDAGRKVYVGGIPYYSTEDDIRSFFEGCGTVTGVDCMMFPESGKFRGIAILTFKTEAAAKRALALDGSDMGGLYLKIQPYKAAAPPTQQRSEFFSPEIIDGYNRIYVGNLAWDITEEDLRGFFQGCKISAVRFGEDKATGEFKGYAHVDFHDGASLAAALKLDQVELCGRPAKISCAVPKRGAPAAAGRVPKPTAGGEQRGTGLPAAAAATAVAGGGKKKKRQTCYECGVPGHLSSECPQKKPAVVAAH